MNVGIILNALYFCRFVKILLVTWNIICASLVVLLKLCCVLSFIWLNGVWHLG